MSQRVGAKRRPMINSAKSGADVNFVPGYRFAHPGYGIPDGCCTLKRENAA
jgi:hypothetical protein